MLIFISCADDRSSIGTSTSEEDVYIPNKNDEQTRENMPRPKNTDWFGLDDACDDNDPNSWGY